MHKCDCPFVLGFLASIGCVHSAKMHANPDWQWTDYDWLLHFSEEDAHMLPLFSAPLANILYSHHQHFRKTIWAGKLIDQKMMNEHSIMEDRAISEFLASETTRGSKAIK